MLILKEKKSYIQKLLKYTLTPRFSIEHLFKTPYLQPSEDKNPICKSIFKVKLYHTYVQACVDYSFFLHLTATDLYV